MKKAKFTYNMNDGFLEDGERIGIWEVLLYLNNLYEENKALKIKYKGFSDKDFSDYLKACHSGD